MKETELRFQVPAAARAAVEAAVAGRSPSRPLRLVARYVDTPERLLAGAGFALRLRREGRRWVQALKGAGDDTLSRFEHEVDRGAAATPPPVDPALHAGTPGGERLLALLAAHPGADLAPRFGSDIRRRVRRVQRAGSTLELAADTGRLVAGERHAPVHELEIELVAGSAHALLAEARRWVAKHALVLDTRTKAERADLLARGEPWARPRNARPPRLAPEMTLVQAGRAVLRSCAEQVLANASQIAAGVHEPEHVHQLRVGLRRLRTGLRLFAPLPWPPTLAEGAAALFRELGAVRDEDVLAGDLGGAIDAALQAAGGGLPPMAAAGGGPTTLAAADAGLPPAPAAAAAPRVRPAAAIVSAPSVQAWLLELIEAGLPTPGDAAAGGEPLAGWFAGRIARWHRRAAREAAGWAGLDDAGRHDLRKRVKRQRYAVEFGAALFPAKAVRAYLKPLRALQEQLGQLNDLALAEAALRAAREAGRASARDWFALGWIGARREALLAGLPSLLEAFVEARRFWK